MSLSRPKQTNPAELFIEWSGSKGKFYYYDKETDQNIYIDDMIYIVILDQLNTIRGYDSDSNSGIYSNEVRNLQTEIINVRSFKGGSIISGLYDQIKGKHDGKFSKSVYAAYVTKKKDQYELKLINLQLYGSAIGAWIDAKIKIEDGKVIGLGASTEVLKKGNTEYFAPVIKKFKSNADIMKDCILMDQKLQEYLDEYLKRNADDSEETEQKEEKKTIQQNNVQQADQTNATDKIEKKEDSFPETAIEEDDLPF